MFDDLLRFRMDVDVGSSVGCILHLVELELRLKIEVAGRCNGINNERVYCPWRDQVLCSTVPHGKPAHRRHSIRSFQGKL